MLKTFPFFLGGGGRNFILIQTYCPLMSIVVKLMLGASYLSQKAFVLNQMQYQYNCHCPAGTAPQKFSLKSIKYVRIRV